MASGWRQGGLLSLIDIVVVRSILYDGSGTGADSGGSGGRDVAAALLDMVDIASGLVDVVEGWIPSAVDPSEGSRTILAPLTLTLFVLSFFCSG